MRKVYDVVIVGGGMVGASLAFALSRLPLKVAVVEAVQNQQRLTSEFDARSIALAYGSQRIFSSLGLWDSFADVALPIQNIHVSDRGRFGAVHFSAKKKQQPALGYMVEVSDLNRVLTTHCQQTANIDWLCPAKCTALSLGDKPEVTLQTEQGEVVIDTKLMVAADGANSSVRQLAGIENKVWDYNQVGIVGNIGLQRDHANVAYERFSDSGPIAMLPLVQQRAAMVWSVSPQYADELLKLDEKDFLLELQEVFGYRLGKFVQTGKLSSFPLKMLRAKEQIKPGLVLIGNASHTLHPIAGQGFNLGLRDVAVLSEVIATHCASELNFSDVPSAYQQQRDADQRKMMGLTDALARVFVNPLRSVSLLRACGLIALDMVPAVKSIFARQTMGMGGKLTRLQSDIPLE